MDNNESLKDIILKEYQDGNIVIMSNDGLMKCKLEDFINQPVEGILYDLNRLEAVVLTFIDDPKWVNDFACAKVIRELKRRLEEQK